MLKVRLDAQIHIPTVSKDSSIVSKHAPAESTKAPIVSNKLRKTIVSSATVSRKPPIGSKELHPIQSTALRASLSNLMLSLFFLLFGPKLALKT